VEAKRGYFERLVSSNVARSSGFRHDDEFDLVFGEGADRVAIAIA
jgi:hypothetical protein